MKKLLIMSTLIALASAASANTVQENKVLFNLQKMSPESHDVVLEINYRLADKCDTVLPIEQLIKKEELFSFLVGMRVGMKEAHLSKPYQVALSNIECNNISAGLPKASKRL